MDSSRDRVPIPGVKELVYCLADNLFGRQVNSGQTASGEQRKSQVFIRRPEDTRQFFKDEP
jgi:hypothetical protein